MPKVTWHIRLATLVVVLVALPACASSSSKSSTTSTSPRPVPVRHLALIDAKTGAIDRDFPDANDMVLSTVADGNGGWYVGGAFTRVGKVAQRGLALLRRDGTLDPAFAPNLPGDHYVDQLLRHGGVVYAGGDFGFVALDARSGRRLWRVSIGSGDQANALAFGNGVLYVSGDFTHIGGVARDGIAALDPASGKPTAWQVHLSTGVTGTPAAVGPVAVADGVVYLSGDFNRVYGVKRELGLAAVSPRTGLPLPTPWVAQLFEDATAILVSHGQVLVGSDFHDSSFAVFDARTARQLPWRDRLGGDASTFAVSGDTVYLGSACPNTAFPSNCYGFDHAGGKPANSLAAVVLPAGRFTNWRPNLDRCTLVYAIAVSGDKVLVAGYFSSSSCSS